LGVPKQADVEADSWSNWYVVSHCNSMQNMFSSRRGIVFFAIKHAAFLVVLAAFVIGLAPGAMLCSVYLALVGFLLLFAAGVRKTMLMLASRGGHQMETLSNVVTILLVAGCLVLVIYLLFVTPLAIASTFLFVDFAVAFVTLFFVLRFIRDTVYLILGRYLVSHPKRFVSIVAYMSSATLQLRVAWLSAVIITFLQIIFSYLLSLFPELHTTFLFNSNLTTRTHGLDNLPRGTLRKLEMGATPKIAARSPSLASGV